MDDQKIKAPVSHAWRQETRALDPAIPGKSPDRDGFLMLFPRDVEHKVRALAPAHSPARFDSWKRTVARLERLEQQRPCFADNAVRRLIERALLRQFDNLLPLFALGFDEPADGYVRPDLRLPLFPEVPEDLRMYLAVLADRYAEYADDALDNIVTGGKGRDGEVPSAGAWYFAHRVRILFFLIGAPEIPEIVADVLQAVRAGFDPFEKEIDDLGWSLEWINNSASYPTEEIPAEQIAAVLLEWMEVSGAQTFPRMPSGWTGPDLAALAGKGGAR